MLKKIFVTTGIIGLFFAAPVSVSMPVAAAAPLKACDIQPSSALCKEEKKKKNAKSVLRSAVEILLFVVGAGSVIAIIYAGLRYLISRGNAQGVEVAKNTLMYAVVGLVVSLSAYAIINWVVQGLP